MQNEAVGVLHHRETFSVDGDTFSNEEKVAVVVPVTSVEATNVCESLSVVEYSTTERDTHICTKQFLSSITHLKID